MPDEGSLFSWIEAAEAGDEDAAQELWKQYFERLVRVARNKMANHPRRAADEEDVALSALGSFLGRMREGRFHKLRDRDDLWRLLVTITARKASNYIRHERREKRGGGRVSGESALVGKGDSSDCGGINQVAGDEPTPEFALLVTEECERRINQLDDPVLCTIAQMKLEGYRNDEIAARVGCALRTVERKVWRIRAMWSEESADE